MSSVYRQPNATVNKATWAGLVTAGTFVLSWLGTVIGQQLMATQSPWFVPAILAGLLLRHRDPIRVLDWAGMFVGLVLANFLWDRNLAAALCLSLSTLAGLGFILYRFTHTSGGHSLRSPRAVGQVLLTALLAALISTALIAGFSLWRPAPALDPALLLIEIIGQTLGYSIILPPMMLARRRWRGLRRLRMQNRENGTPLLPAGLLLLSLTAPFILQGPGAIAYPIPALLICALAYRQVTTAWLILLTTVFLMAASGPSGDPLQSGLASWAHASLLLGILLCAISPLLVSSMLASRSDLILSLHKALDHDDLTQALSRQAFLRRAEKQLQQVPPAPRGHALMMLDIDSFKQFNDHYGHAAGDQVLHHFAQAIRDNIRPQDQFGRLGGEEFALMLPDTSPEELAATAERLRAVIETRCIYLDHGDCVHISVSIGTMHDSRAPKADLSTLLAYADQAMYQAKRSGRNQVCQYNA